MTVIPMILSDPPQIGDATTERSRFDHHTPPPDGTVGGPDEPIFHQPWWLDAAAPRRWDVVTVDRGGRTVAALPFVVRGPRRFRVLSQPALTPFLGPWVNPRWLNALASLIIAVLLMLSGTLMVTTLFPHLNAGDIAIWLSIALAAGGAARRGPLITPGGRQARWPRVDPGGAARPRSGRDDPSTVGGGRRARREAWTPECRNTRQVVHASRWPPVRSAPRSTPPAGAW